MSNRAMVLDDLNDRSAPAAGSSRPKPYLDLDALHHRRHGRFPAPTFGQGSRVMRNLGQYSGLEPRRRGFCPAWTPRARLGLQPMLALAEGTAPGGRPLSTIPRA